MTAGAQGLGTSRESYRRLSGWGRSTGSVARVVPVSSPGEIADAILLSGPRGIVPLGAGRSYGDAAQNGGGTLVDLSTMSEVRLSHDGTQVVAGAGVTLDELLRWMLPRGLMIPVSPGTSQVTLGGMVAADVHGKNHHRLGSFGEHVTRIDLVDGLGEQRSLTREDPAFWATTGGMGLTGVITEVAFVPLRVSTSRFLVDVTRYDVLDDLMMGMREADLHASYSVAWLDSVGAHGPLGRGILSTAEHAEVEDLPIHERADALSPGTRRSLPMPPVMPAGMLNPATIGAFNATWFAREGRPRAREIQHMSRFFHPLDRIRGWNRLYGRAGFIQYQFAVPDHAAGLIPEVLHRLARAGAPSFLTVLKRFGPGSLAPLSFPRPGWTLALDLPASTPGLRQELPSIDRLVVSAEGRFYLAKDAHIDPGAFAAGYPRLDEWRSIRQGLDPERRFISDLARRLDLVPSG